MTSYFGCHNSISCCTTEEAYIDLNLSNFLEDIKFFFPHLAKKAYYFINRMYKNLFILKLIAIKWYVDSGYIFIEELTILGLRFEVIW